MSSQLTYFVSPITGPLEGLQQMFSQLASLHRDAHQCLRSQGGHLTSAGGLDAFLGAGGTAFSSGIEHYVAVSEKHMHALDLTSRMIADCLNGIRGSTDAASSAALDEAMVGHVLSQLTPDAVIQEGAAAVQAIVSEMRHTLDNMISTGGNFFGQVLPCHISNAGHDAGQQRANAQRLANNAINLLEQVGHVLTPWSQEISNAVKNHMDAIQKAADYINTLIGTLTTAISQFKSALKSNSVFKTLIPFLDSAKGTVGLFGAGFLLDYLSGKDHSANTLASDIVGNGLGAALGLTPEGRAVIIGFGVIHGGGAAMSWGQNWFSHFFPGTIGEELKQPAEGLHQASENANLGRALDDLGHLIVETRLSNVPTDATHTISDAWKLVKSVPQFAVRARTALQDDQLALMNTGIQNIPLLPRSLKDAANWGTTMGIKAINVQANFILNNWTAIPIALSPIPMGGIELFNIGKNVITDTIPNVPNTIENLASTVYHKLDIFG